MTKEDYYKRMSKIDTMIRTDRTSIDEDYHIACQRYYLSNKYIKTLEQENKQLKDNWNKLKEFAQEKYDNPTWASCGARYVLEKMQELEKGDSNG